VAYLVSLVAGLAFGAADQYLGSRSALGAWAATVSMVSAPWLLLSFVAGLTQERGRRAMALGLAVVVPALVGYFAMTCSPMENVPLGRFSTCFLTIARTSYNPLWIAGGMLFGPLYGLLGQRWHVDRSWKSAALVAGTLCLEPLARLVVAPWMLSPAPAVWWSEVAVGGFLAVSFAYAIATSRRARAGLPPAG
jgi:hypothetical protein